jgi:hypothetical protein
VEHPVGQTPHLGVAALLAGVATYGIWQGNYLPEGPEDRTSDGETAGLAAGPQFGSPMPQLARSTPGRRCAVVRKSYAMAFSSAVPLLVTDPLPGLVYTAPFRRESSSKALLRVALELAHPLSRNA